MHENPFSQTNFAKNVCTLTKEALFNIYAVAADKTK